MYTPRPELEIIVLGKESNQTECLKRYHSRVNTIHRYVGEIAIGDEACFVPYIVFHSVD